MDADKEKPPTGIVSRLRVVFARESRRSSGSPSAPVSVKRRTSRSPAAPAATQTPPPRATEPEVAAVATVESNVPAPNGTPLATTAQEPDGTAETRERYPLLDTFAPRRPDEIAIISFNMLADHVRFFPLVVVAALRALWAGRRSKTTKTPMCVIRRVQATHSLR